MWECRTIARSPALCSGTADGEEIECPVEVVAAQREVAGGDRRGEAVVEGPGQPQRPVHAIPAEPDRDLVRAQLAGVVEAEQLDSLEVVLAELPELGRAVLAHVPGVVRLLRAGGRQGEQVRGGDVDGA